MTDEEVFVAMCKRFELQPEKRTDVLLGPAHEKQFGQPAVSYTLEAGEAERQIGYRGFFGQWHFSADGKFLVVGFWE